MNVAFYAPLKSPNHTVPSGDRTMARALIAALQDGGCTVDLASELRSRDSKGSPETQDGLVAEAATQATDIIAKGKTSRWKAWITYHTYYKAPDLLGPTVSKALGIPYFLVEASRAKKRLTGPWADFAALSEAACDAAHSIFYLTEHDAIALKRDAPVGQNIIHLRPFLNQTALPQASTLSGPMLSIGMMRHGDKLASYQLIADTLAILPDNNWQLDIAGDGPARSAVEQMMAPFKKRVRFLGALDEAAMAHAYASARLLFWPGVNEAFGMTYLEAQAAGVPIVAQDRPGVRDVTEGTYPVPEKGPQAMANAILALYNDPNLLVNKSESARAFVQARHLRPAATQQLMDGIKAAIKDTT